MLQKASVVALLAISIFASSASAVRVGAYECPGIIEDGDGFGWAMTESNPLTEQPGCSICFYERIDIMTGETIPGTAQMTACN